MGHPVAGRGGQRGVEVAEGVLQAALARERDAAVEQRLGVAGTEAEDLGAVGDGALEVALRDPGPGAGQEDERPPAGWVPAVNGPLDWFATGATPPSILRALPSLPGVLQYRFVKLDLVLLDVDANLIVDILPGAVAAE